MFDLLHCCSNRGQAVKVSSLILISISGLILNSVSCLILNSVSGLVLNSFIKSNNIRVLCWFFKDFRAEIFHICSMYVCMKAAPREEHPNLGLHAYSVIFCLCLRARMYHRRSLVSAFETESTWNFVS